MELRTEVEALVHVFYVHFDTPRAIYHMAVVPISLADPLFPVDIASGTSEAYLLITIFLESQPSLQTQDAQEQASLMPGPTRPPTHASQLLPMLQAMPAQLHNARRT
eukprot:CAMPEP_0178457300 /NCGR_PEP_ID=MMETSP0689_2-20121128/46945_1 /TAXON_ID=160604 /ORGANISM="Amphidinium massartii, Strain CS-259" /LENGTH=106 /DNA_ID=CAMNT_0020083545 /DNA_START=797 /DNA_END=1114 /DNA_ORIENTATION=-